MFLLKEFQQKAVNDLLSFSYEALSLNQNKTPILLESPTGSGKTVMMASYLERLVNELHLQPSLHDNVAFIWFAPNTLHIQSFHKLQQLYADAGKLNCLELSSLSSNPQLNPNDLLFINWSKVDSDKNIWRNDNESNANLETLIEKTKLNDTEIVLIIDEAHKNALTGKQAISVRNLINAKIEIFVTATPPGNLRIQRTVFIDRTKVIAEEMIKKAVKLNIDLSPEEQNGDNVHIHLLRTAFKKKAELQKLFDDELGENQINPLILIQLPSENESLSEEDKEIRDVIVALLATEFDITSNNGKLAIWLSGERDTSDIERINGLQDVLVFKQAIAQGWDCPRACILVSYRNVKSKSFGIQTVGRILRMPHQRHYSNDTLNYGYVYTNQESSKISFAPEDEDYIFSQSATRQNNKNWVFDNLTASSIVNDRPSPGVLSSVFEQQFFQIMENRYGIKQLPDVDLFTQNNEDIVKKQSSRNRELLKQNGWEFEIDEHQIHLPANVDVDPYQVNSIMLNSNQIKSFAVTTAEFSTYFERFCYENITRLNRSKSWKKLRETLVHFAEYYLSMFETSAHKFFLYPQNKALLIAHITNSLEKFDIWQTAKGNENKRVVLVGWEVPKVRFYSKIYTAEHIEQHALIPFYESDQVSTPEVLFKDFLLKNQEHIDWWYKNGDNGKENFAVDYINIQKELKLFFVDFVIKFKNGVLGLFDTKTRRSDENAHKKHNALLDYVERRTEQGKPTIGGVIIPVESSNIWSFRYAVNRISDTNDLTGWDFFNPSNINTK